MELGRRVHCEEAPPRPRLDSPEAVAGYLTPRHATHPHEVFGILALDSRHRLLGEKVVATGGRHSVAVTPADVFQTALPYRPRSVVAFHNHPSGDPHPSEEDKALTYRLARSGEVLGIALVGLLAAVGDAALVAVGQCAHEPVHPRGARRLEDILLGGTGPAVGDVLGDRPADQPGVLKHHADPGAQRLPADVTDVMAVDHDPAGVDVVEPHQQIDQRGLARPGRPDDGHRAAGLGHQ